MRTLLLGLALLTGPVSEAVAAPPDQPAEIDRLRGREVQLLDRIRAFDEARYEQMLRLKESDLRAYYWALAKVARSVDRPRPESPELVEELRRLEAMRARYPQGLSEVGKQELASVRREATEIAERIFDIKQKLRRAKIEELRAALSDLESDVARRDRERKALIERFVDDVMWGNAGL